MRARACHRVCCGCRRRFAASSLVRLTANANGDVRVTGIAGIIMAHGRAHHACPNERCMRKAMGRLTRRRRVEQEEAWTLLQSASNAAKVYWVKRRNGLQRRGIAATDPTCDALRSMLISLAGHVDSDGVGA